MSSASDLYRRAKSAQWEAERGGFTNTAAALAAIAEMLAAEAGLDPWVIPESYGPPAPWPPDAPPLPHRDPSAHERRGPLQRLEPHASLSKPLTERPRPFPRGARDPARPPPATRSSSPPGEHS